MPRVGFRSVGVALLFLAALGSTASADPGGVGGVPFTVPLTGAAEVPRPADPDGTGVANLRLNPGREQVCYDLTVSDIIVPATGAHIHRGTSTESGPIVVALGPPDESGTSSGCVSADRELIREISTTPSGTTSTFTRSRSTGLGRCAANLGKAPRLLVVRGLTTCAARPYQLEHAEGPVTWVCGQFPLRPWTARVPPHRPTRFLPVQGEEFPRHCRHLHGMRRSDTGPGMMPGPVSLSCSQWRIWHV